MYRSRIIFYALLLMNSKHGLAMQQDGQSHSDVPDTVKSLIDAGKRDEAFKTLFDQANNHFCSQDFAGAQNLFLATLAINPTCAQAHFNLGVVYQNLQKPDDALACFEKAVACNAHYPRAHYSLGKAYALKQLIPQAIEQFTRTIELEPSNWQAHTELARALRSQEKHAQSLEHFEKAASINPGDMLITHDLALAYINLGQTEKARTIYRMLIAQSPDNTHALYNTGYSYVMDGNLDEAIRTYQQVLTINPKHEQAKFALGHAYLRKGDLASAWQQHAWFYKDTGRISDSFATYMASGTFAGKKVLLRPEGGLGDTIQFIRYAQLLKEMGATTIVCMQKPLMPLFTKNPHLDIVVASGNAVPSYDAHITIMSLPAGFKSTANTIPHNIPYIYPDPALIEKWKSYFADDAKCKIGICWQADVFNDSSRPLIAHRGIPLSFFYSLSDFAQASFYSLQKHDGLEQLIDLPGSFPLQLLPTFDEQAGPFMDTAAIMESLDLIITVDTALAHLAGALGKRVWLLLPYSVDWRWIVGRTDSPWYPTMRIFKQQTPLNWQPVMDEVYEALKELLATRNTSNKKEII